MLTRNLPCDVNKMGSLMPPQASASGKAIHTIINII